jgi:hypothetical protein
MDAFEEWPYDLQQVGLLVHTVGVGMLMVGWTPPSGRGAGRTQPVSVYNHGRVRRKLQEVPCDSRWACGVLALRRVPFAMQLWFRPV